MKKSAGFSIIEGLLVIVVIVIIGAVGYTAYTHVLAPQSSTVASSPSPTPVTIEKSADLDKASTALDDTVLDDSDTSQLDNLTNSF